MITRDEKGRVSLGRWEYLIQALIIVSLLDSAIDTLPSLTPFQNQLLQASELVTIIVFSIELILRCLLSRPRTAYIFSVQGFIDVVAILPFFFLSGVDLRCARAFKLLRLFRLFKLVRYSQAIKRFHRAFVIAREELVIFGVTALIVFYLSSVGIFYFEHDAQPEVFASVFHSFWWSVCTLTTVGYGDIYPVTAAGKFFTFLVLMTGLGFVAIPTGLIASALATARREEKEKKEHEVRNHKSAPTGESELESEH